MDIDRRYVNVAVQRWQTFTGQPAVLASEEQIFDDLASRPRDVESGAQHRAKIFLYSPRKTLWSLRQPRLVRPALPAHDRAPSPLPAPSDD